MNMMKMIARMISGDDDDDNDDADIATVMLCRRTATAHAFFRSEQSRGKKIRADQIRAGGRRKEAEGRRKDAGGRGAEAGVMEVRAARAKSKRQGNK